MDRIKEVLKLLELSMEASHATGFGHLTMEEGALHQVDIAKQICQLFESDVKLLQVVGCGGEANDESSFSFIPHIEKVLQEAQLTEAQKESAYSPAETQMIMCMTRERECTPERCLKCGWLRDEVKERLNNDQAEYVKHRRLTMDKQPTEVCQDKLVGIKQAIDQVGITLCYALFAYNDDLISEEVMNLYRDTYAQEILSLLASRRGGKCKKCSGTGEGLHHFPCYDCNGTGYTGDITHTLFEWVKLGMEKVNVNG